MMRKRHRAWQAAERLAVGADADKRKGEPRAVRDWRKLVL